MDLPHGAEDPDLLYFERRFWDQGYYPVAGLDEVGRGCLAGPVVAAAVVLPRDIELPGVNDSKTLSPGTRTEMDILIRDRAVSVSVAQVSAGEIDRINILQASLKAMAMAVDALSVRPQVLLVDGNRQIPHPLPQKTLVKGDRRSLSVAAASIVAKVYRDHLMVELDSKYPGYHFAGHKGYPTAIHKEALRRNGCTPVHRRTFRGVKEVL